MNYATKIPMLLIFSFISLVSEGQPFELSESGRIIAIKGTSSLHDWQMDLIAFNSGFHLNQDGTLIKELDNVTFSCKVKDIKSESSLMDSKAYNALRADNFPEINFSGTSVTGLVSEGNNFTGNLTGKLHVAGETQDVTIPFNGTFIDNKTININATADLNMSSFNITPPTFLLGALKTGDKISVLLSMQYVQKAQ